MSVMTPDEMRARIAELERQLEAAEKRIARLQWSIGDALRRAEAAEAQLEAAPPALAQAGEGEKP